MDFLTCCRFGNPERTDFYWRVSDLIRVVKFLLVLAVIMIPIASALGFIHFQPNCASLFGLLKKFITIFALIALPEEFLFRGVIQNSLTKYFKFSQGISLAMATLIFALSHINNAKPGFPVPDWTYVGLAVIAQTVTLKNPS